MVAFLALVMALLVLSVAVIALSMALAEGIVMGSAAGGGVDSGRTGSGSDSQLNA